jgi:hypothetical protein
MLSDEQTRAGRQSIKLWFILSLVGSGPYLASVALAEHISFRLIDGKPCARCTLAGARSSIPANVVFELGMESALLVDRRAAEVVGLPAETGATLEFNDLQLPRLPARVGESEVLEELTREHAPELGEIPATAVVGLRAFGEFTPQIDFVESLIRLLPLRENAIGGGAFIHAGEPRPGAAADNGALIPFEVRDGRLCLQAEGPEEFPLTVLLSTLQHDTLIDATTTALLDAPGGQLEVLQIGRLNVAAEVALRPEDLSSGWAGQRDAVLGTGFLSSYRMTVDLGRRQLALERVRQPRFPEEERAYFVARANDDADAIESFLEQHASSRLVGEASVRLIHLRLEQTPRDVAAVRRAVRLRAQRATDSKRARVMVALADRLMATDEQSDRDVAREALGLGLEYAADDPDARAVHDIHARLGRISLHDGNLQEARRHLLSAAFGLPRDPLVNLWLGQVYERSGKLSRAWSRYVRSALAGDPPPEAWGCLDRLNRDPAFRAGFSMRDASDLLEGHVVEFHPPDRFMRDHDPACPAVCLVELFTCVDHAQTAAAELAFGGLWEYLADTNVVLLTYHLPYPEPEPLVSEVALSRARFYGLDATPVALFDGGDAVDLGGDESAASEVYEAYRMRCKPPATSHSAPWRVVGEALLEGGVISGKVTALGPSGQSPLRLFLVLCEDTIMVPGGNSLLLHRHVARARVSPEGGYRVSPEPGPHEIAFTVPLSEVTRQLEKRVAHMEQDGEFEFRMKPTYVDGRTCFVACILQDVESKQVLAATRIAVKPAEDETS